LRPGHRTLDVASKPAAPASDRTPARVRVVSTKRGRRAGWVGRVFATEEIAMSESTQDRPDEADEKTAKPGEGDTETVAGQPKKAPDSKEQSKQDE
jgi:hypothetical protein